MGIHSLTRTRPDEIVIHCVGIDGVSVHYQRRPTRAPEKSCRDTIPGYTQIITCHNGRNALLGDRRGWVTHIAHQSGLKTCLQFQEDNVMVYVIFPDDIILHITLAVCALTTQGLTEPTPGLWQITTLHRPGLSEELYLPRLLYPFELHQRRH